MLFNEDKLEVRTGLLEKLVKMSSGTGGRLITLFRSINDSLEMFSGYFSLMSIWKSACSLRKHTFLCSNFGASVAGRVWL